MQFSLWQVLVLAVVQGIAEFLPISSDGHLVVIAPLLFGGSESPPGLLSVSIALHVGTLGSILLYYHRRLARLLGDFDRLSMGGNRIESLQLLSVHLSFVEGKRVFDSSLPTQKSLSNLAES